MPTHAVYEVIASSAAYGVVPIVVGDPDFGVVTNDAVNTIASDQNIVAKEASHDVWFIGADQMVVPIGAEDGICQRYPAYQEATISAMVVAIVSMVRLIVSTPSVVGVPLGVCPFTLSALHVRGHRRRRHRANDSFDGDEGECVR